MDRINNDLNKVYGLMYQYIGGSKGGCQGCAPPLGVQILSISCSFWGKMAK